MRRSVLAGIVAVCTFYGLMPAPAQAAKAPSALALSVKCNSVGTTDVVRPGSATDPWETPDGTSDASLTLTLTKATDQQINYITVDRYHPNGDGSETVWGWWETVTNVGHNRDVFDMLGVSGTRSTTLINATDGKVTYTLGRRDLLRVWIPSASSNYGSGDRYEVTVWMQSTPSATASCTAP